MLFQEQTVHSGEGGFCRKDNVCAESLPPAGSAGAPVFEGSELVPVGTVRFRIAFFSLWSHTVCFKTIALAMSIQLIPSAIL